MALRALLLALVALAAWTCTAGGSDPIDLDPQPEDPGFQPPNSVGADQDDGINGGLLAGESVGDPGDRAAVDAGADAGADGGADAGQ